MTVHNITSILVSGQSFSLVFDDGDAIRFATDEDTSIKLANAAVQLGLLVAWGDPSAEEGHPDSVAPAPVDVAPAEVPAPVEAVRMVAGPNGAVPDVSSETDPSDTQSNSTDIPQETIPASETGAASPASVPSLSGPFNSPA